MNTLNDYVNTYLEYCKYRKRLDTKTWKTYAIDSKQYKLKTVKRKIASLKAFFHYLEYIDVLSVNLF